MKFSGSRLRRVGRSRIFLLLVLTAVLLTPLQAGAVTKAIPAVTITSTTLPSGTAGNQYAVTLNAIGGTAPYTWSLLTGAIPTGLVLNSSGSLVGVPGVPATYAIALRATDINGLTTTATVALVIHPQPPIPQSIVTVTSLGVVVTTGTAYAVRSVSSVPATPVVAIASSPTGKGSWTVTADGQVGVVGAVPSYGSLPPSRAKNRVVGIAANDTGSGYWIVTALGKVYGFGAAKKRGSISPDERSGRVVAISRAARGNGYFLVTTTGAVYGFGSARAVGSVAARRHHVHIAGISATPSGNGYWVATTAGGVYRFGDARRDLVTGPVPVGTIVGIATASTGIGYYLATTAGIVYSYGSAMTLPALAPTGGRTIGIATAV